MNFQVDGYLTLESLLLRFHQYQGEHPTLFGNRLAKRFPKRISLLVSANPTSTRQKTTGRAAREITDDYNFFSTVNEFGHAILDKKLPEGLHFVVMLHPYVPDNDTTNNVFAGAFPHQPLLRYRNLLTYQKKTWVLPRKYDPQVNAEEWILQGNPERKLTAEGSLAKLYSPCFHPITGDFEEVGRPTRARFVDTLDYRISDHRARLRRHLEVGGDRHLKRNRDGNLVTQESRLTEYRKKLCREYRPDVTNAEEQARIGLEIDNEFLLDRLRIKLGELVYPNASTATKRVTGQNILLAVEDDTILPEVQGEELRRREIVQRLAIRFAARQGVTTAVREGLVYAAGLDAAALQLARDQLPTRLRTNPILPPPEQLYPVDARMIR